MVALSGNAMNARERLAAGVAGETLSVMLLEKLADYLTSAFSTCGHRQP